MTCSFSRWANFGAFSIFKNGDTRKSVSNVVLINSSFILFHVVCSTGVPAKGRRRLYRKDGNGDGMGPAEVRRRRALSTTRSASSYNGKQRVPRNVQDCWTFQSYTRVLLVRGVRERIEGLVWSEYLPQIQNVTSVLLLLVMIWATTLSDTTIIHHVFNPHPLIYLAIND